MKTSKLRSVLIISAVSLAGGLMLTGCQGAGAGKSAALNQGAKASDSIQSAADLISGARGQINTTLAALRNLTERPTDIPAQYKVVLAELAKLQDTATKVTAAADGMRTKGDAYLADWGRQVAAISTPELRGAAYDRRAEVAAQLQGIFQSFQKTKASFAPFKASMADIKTALSADLSPKGLEAVKPFVAKATAAAEPLKADLEKLAGEFRAVGLELQPVAPAGK